MTELCDSHYVSEWMKTVQWDSLCNVTYIKYTKAWDLMYADLTYQRLNCSRRSVLWGKTDVTTVSPDLSEPVCIRPHTYTCNRECVLPKLVPPKACISTQWDTTSILFGTHHESGNRGRCSDTWWNQQTGQKTVKQHCAHAHTARLKVIQYWKCATRDNLIPYTTLCA